jgi:hypothetical protein
VAAWRTARGGRGEQHLGVLDYNAVPFDPRKPFDQSGIRLGTPAATSALSMTTFFPYTFYRTVFNEVLARDPNRALQAAALVMPGIDMPGVSMPHFRELADAVRRVGIYGPREYLQIVKEQIEFWKIGALDGLNEMARIAREKIMGIPARLERVADVIESRAKRNTFSFELTFAREFALD